MLTVAVWGLLAVRPALAQPAAGAESAAPFPVTAAVASQTAPLLDGVVLGDPAWTEAVPATGFRQTKPDEGEPASERTEVRVVFTESTLYVGVVCYDRDAGSITISDSRRDSSLDDSDSVQIILDTFLDQQSGFVFGTSPAGQEYDGQVVNAGEGRLGRSTTTSSGSGAGFNGNWDGVWEVRTTVSDVGWSAEFAIPFRTVSYPARDVQTWGLNVQRNIRRRNEIVYWAPLPRQYNLLRLSLAGQLSGIRVPAATQRSLKIVPYVAGDLAHSDVRSRTTTLGDVGADLKYAVGPSLTLDLTYNTDFAQVEVDRQQINLDRFSLFFPEKRPFFLENAGLFSVGQQGAVDIFFSRRIGLGADGGQIPILGGGRLSGKIGRNTNVGFLSMQQDSVGATGTPQQNFTVARVRQDLGNRSNFGAIVVNRQATGELVGEDDFNRTYAVDGRWGVGQSGTITGFAADTETPGLASGDTHAYALSGQHESSWSRVGLGYTEVAPNFNPEVGFLAREGYRRMNASVFTTFRPDDLLGLHEIRPHVFHNTFFDFDTGRHETQFTHIDNHLEWRNGYEIHTGMNITREGVFEAFEIFPGVVVPPGSYDHAEMQIAGNTNLGAPISAQLNSFVGGLFGGDRISIQPSVTVRVGETFNTSFEWSYNDLRLPGGDFTTNLARLRASYSFTTRMFFQALVQYNDRADLWSSNLRFGLLSDANTGLFVVYNDIQGIGSGVPTGAGRTLTLKYSYLFDLLR